MFLPQKAALLAAALTIPLLGTASAAPTTGTSTASTSACTSTVSSNLGRALATADAGDVLCVASGTYTENIRVRAGAKDVVVQAAPGARPVVQGLLWLHDIDGWVIDGINVTWDDRNDPNQHMVKFTGGAGWRYTNAEVWGAKSYAAILVAGDPMDWSLDRLYVHDTAPSNGVNQDHLIYANAGAGGGTIERNLLVGSANGRAVKVGSPSGDVTDNVAIRYNTMVENRGPVNVQLSDRTSGVTIERNIMVGSDAHNIRAYGVRGSGNLARNNIGWGSNGVLQDSPVLADGGGNLHVDPELDEHYEPTNPMAQGYGHTAP